MSQPDKQANSLDDERVPPTPRRSRSKVHRGPWSSEPLRRFHTPPPSPTRSGASTLPTPPRSPFRVDRPPLRPNGLGLIPQVWPAPLASVPPAAPPPTPPRTPKSGKGRASPASRRRWIVDRAASQPPAPGRRRATPVEEGELRDLDARLRHRWGRPPGSSLNLVDPEPDLIRPAQRLEDAEFPDAPRPGPYVIRAIEGFPVEGAAVLEDEDAEPAIFQAPLLAQLAAPDPNPSSPAAPFPDSGDDDVDNDEEDDAASRLATSIRAPSTSGSRMIILPIPNQPSPPDLSSTDSDGEP